MLFGLFYDPNRFLHNLDLINESWVCRASFANRKVAYDVTHLARKQVADQDQKLQLAMLERYETNISKLF